MPISRSPDFRYFSANQFTVRAGDADLTIVFSVNEAGSGEPSHENAFEQGGLVLTWRAAKTLGTILLKASQQVEDATGRNIEMGEILSTDQLGDMKKIN